MSRLVFYHPAPEWDGLARVYLEVGKALAARGVTVAIACPEGSHVAAADYRPSRSAAGGGACL